MIGLKQLTDMKKFVIHYNYYATVDVTVLANSKEDAIEKADQIEFDNNDFELDFESREVFESEDATSKGITVWESFGILGLGLKNQLSPSHYG